jgi:hypothetical protein
MDMWRGRPVLARLAQLAADQPPHASTSSRLRLPRRGVSPTLRSVPASGVAWRFPVNVRRGASLAPDRAAYGEPDARQEWPLAGGDVPFRSCRATGETGAPGSPSLRDTRPMKLYFAGPLFTTPERTWNAEVTSALRAAGHGVFLPQDGNPARTARGSSRPTSAGSTGRTFSWRSWTARIPTRVRPGRSAMRSGRGSRWSSSAPTFAHWPATPATTTRWSRRPPRHESTSRRPRPRRSSRRSLTRYPG